ncbi:MAG: PatB family C-S lyase [Clostridia bacterium]|nr:PatB family C-S lyase [Clostridia bacterium]
MKHDFKSIPDRSKFGSSKWNIAPNASTEFVPLSVADMEFPTAKPIVKDLKKLADEAVLGYTVPTEEYNDAVIFWMKRRHGFEIEKEWMIQTPGVINALCMLIEAMTKPGDGIIIMPPVYYPFDMSIIAKSRHVVYCPLINKGNTYEIDYALLRKKASAAKNTALIFSNPHNPIGKVWSEAQLRKVAEICCDNGVFIIDDEIHNDLIMPGHTHTVMANVSERAKNNIAVCTAPSKTFNLAGLQCSNIIIPNKEIRARAEMSNLINMQMHLNIFAYTACTAAYNKCEDWLEELIGVIDSNAKLVEDFMAKNFPEVKVYPLEGTYLQWLDVSGLGFNHIEMRKILEGANIYLDNGEMFGALGRGFQRINLACAKTTIKKMLIRFKDAVDKAMTERKEKGSEYGNTLAAGDIMEDFVYNSPYKSDCKLKDEIAKPTLLVFSRYYGCELCGKLLATIKAAYPALKALGYDVKFIMQSDIDTLSDIQEIYPFELIADPDAKLYKKYSIFEADSIYNFIAGDKAFEKTVGNDIHSILGTEFADNFINKENSEHRELQLSAFIGVDKEMKVIYSHYCKTMTDYPAVKELLNGMKTGK